MDLMIDRNPTDYLRYPLCPHRQSAVQFPQTIQILLCGIVVCLTILKEIPGHDDQLLRMSGQPSYILFESENDIL